MQLDQVKAIITGGASGLGHAVAQHLVAHGAQVALFDVNEEKGQAAAKALDGVARFYRTDVTSEDGVAANVAAAREAMGGLNVVMNCAGILGAGRVLGKEGPMPLGTFASTVMVNLVGSFNVAKAAAALMQHNEAGEDGERGVIVNTASVAAYEGQIGQAAYSASASAWRPSRRASSGRRWSTACRRRCRSRCPPRSRSRRASASPRSSRRPWPSSSATATSTARPSAWMARCGCSRSKRKRGTVHRERAVR
jgi:NADP-dependent 3-hydroxy acid dehydrogenase YdfG